MRPLQQTRATGFAMACVFIALLGLGACDPDMPETIAGPAFVAATDGAWDRPVSPATAAALDAGFARARDLPESKAITVAIRSGRSGNWQASTGDVADRFWWASSGKLATTMLALQEVEAGNLALDGDLAPFLPLVSQGITLRRLLTHTSGIADFARLELLAGQYGLADRQALLRAALAHERDFPPGEGWAYSNSGFLLVQDLLEATTGDSYAALVENRIARPLGLTGFAAPAENVPPDVILPALGTPLPASEFPPNIGGAGSIVATAAEMAAFWQAAMAGALAGPQSLNEALARLHPFFGSRAMQMGAGMIVYPASDDSGYWLGHGGGAEQVTAIVLYSPSRQMVIAIAGVGPDVPAMDIANILIETLDLCEAGRC